MNIGIIGAGHIGGTLALKLTKLGHQVRITNSRGPATLVEVASKTGARPVTIEDAVRDVSVVIISIPVKSVPQLPKGLFASVPKEVIVVDTGNYYQSFRDGRIEAIESGRTESEWVSDMIGRPVVKVFNSVMEHSLAEGSRPKGAADRIALPVAGDDVHAKAVIIRLLDELGFDGVDAGGISESWRQQPGAPAYCTDLPTDKLRRALARADRTKLADVREAAIAKLSSMAPA